MAVVLVTNTLFNTNGSGSNSSSSTRKCVRFERMLNSLGSASSFAPDVDPDALKSLSLGVYLLVLAFGSSMRIEIVGMADVEIGPATDSNSVVIQQQTAPSSAFVTSRRNLSMG